MTNDALLRQWLKRGNSHFDGASVHEAISKAWVASSLQMSLPDFTDCLRRTGILVDCIQPGVFRITPPSRPN